MSPYAQPVRRWGGRVVRVDQNVGAGEGLDGTHAPRRSPGTDPCTPTSRTCSGSRTAPPVSTAERGRHAESQTRAWQLRADETCIMVKLTSPDMCRSKSFQFMRFKYAISLSARSVRKRWGRRSLLGTEKGASSASYLRGTPRAPPTPKESRTGSPAQCTMKSEELRVWGEAGVLKTMAYLTEQADVGRVQQDNLPRRESREVVR